MSVIASNLFAIVYSYEFTSNCENSLKNMPFILAITNTSYAVVMCTLIALIVIYAKSFRMEERIKLVTIAFGNVYNMVFLIIGCILKNHNCFTESILLICIPVSIILMTLGYILIHFEEKQIKKQDYELIVSI